MNACMHANRAPVSARLIVMWQSELFLPLPAAHAKHQHHDANTMTLHHGEYTHVLRYTNPCNTNRFAYHTPYIYIHHHIWEALAAEQAEQGLTGSGATVRNTTATPQTCRTPNLLCAGNQKVFAHVIERHVDGHIRDSLDVVECQPPIQPLDHPFLLDDSPYCVEGRLVCECVHAYEQEDTCNT